MSVMSTLYAIMTEFDDENLKTARFEIKLGLNLELSNQVCCALLSLIKLGFMQQKINLVTEK